MLMTPDEFPGTPADDARPPPEGGATAGLVVEPIMFLSSYAPLFAMLAVRFEPWWLVVLCGTLALVGLAAGLLVVHRFQRLPTSRWVLVAVEDRGEEVAGYLATYLLPLLTVAEPSVRDLVAYGLFLSVTAVVYIRSGLIRINPTLYVLRWHLHAVQIGEAGWSGYVLSRQRLRVGDQLRGVRLTERVFISREGRG